MEKNKNSPLVLLKISEALPHLILFNFKILAHTPRIKETLAVSAKKKPWLAFLILHVYEEDSKYAPFLRAIAEGAIEGARNIIDSEGIKDKSIALKIAQSTDRLHTLPKLRYALLDTLST